MPKIPLLQTDKVITSPKMSPQAAAAPYLALARAEQKVTQVADYTMWVLGAIEKAERSVKASELESQMRSDLEDAAESFRMRTDFENFDKDADQLIKDIRAKYDDSIGDDQRLQEAVDRAYEWRSSEFIRTIQAKKAEVITNRGKGQIQKMVNQYLEDYAGELNEKGRTLIKDKIAATAQAFAESGIITFKEAENIIQNFTDDAEENRADRYIGVDPENALKLLKANKFELTPKSKQAKIEKAQTTIRQKRAEEEKRQREAEAAHKKQIEENDFAAWQSFHNGELTVSGLNELADMRKISLKAYNGIMKKYKGEGLENDPVVVGEISEALELGIEIEPILADALERGQIKTSSYISLKKAVGSREYKRGLYYINNSLKPTQFEKWSPDKFWRHAQAIEDYNARVAEGQDPLEVSKEIVDLHLSDIRRTFVGLRRPKFLIGPRTELTALQEAEERTVTAFDTGEISPDEFNREAELIQELMELVNEMADKAPGADTEELEKRIKKQEKK